MKQDLKTKSKYLSLILRHDPSAGGIEVDENGWAKVADLVHHSGFTRKELDDIVAKDNKQRYSYDETKQRIRANQGHSLKHVKIEFDEVEPPPLLYHGTVQKYIDSIMKEGLKKQSRNYLHLSEDRETASFVGARRGKPVILTILAQKMYEDGYTFYISKNRVYLVEFVPAKYIFIDYSV